MGIFGSSKKTYVSSVLYNLSGDITKRPLYKTTLVASAIFNKNPLAEAITNGYLKGGAMRLRSYERWARTQGYRDFLNYEASTMPAIVEIDAEKVLQYINHEPTEALELVSHDIGAGNYEFWVEQYMFAHYPDVISDESAEWTYDFNEKTNVIRIALPGGNLATNTNVVSFSPENYDPTAQYLYIYFRRNKSGEVVKVTPGDWTDMFDWDMYPDTFSWDLVTDNTVTTPITYTVMVETTQSFSDGRPSIVTNSSYEDTIPREDFSRVYERIVFIGSKESDSTDVLMNQKQTMTQEQITNTEPYTDSNVSNDTIEGGVLRTTISFEQKLRPVMARRYKVDKENSIALSLGMPEVFIYRQGDGIAELDAMFGTPAEIERGYYPPIPIRIDNEFVRDTRPEMYEWTKKAFKRAFASKIEKLYKTLEEGDKDSDPEEVKNNLKEMDYIYLVFGVSLNTKDNSGRRYIYEYFKYLSDSYGDETNLPSFQAQWEAAERSNNEFRQWVADQGRFEPADNGLAGAPPTIPYPKIPKRSVYLRAADGYNIELSWGFITEKTIYGKYKPTAKVGDVFIDPAGFVNLEGKSLTDDEKEAYATGAKLFLISHSLNTIKISYQHSANQFTQLTVVNPNYKNTIYQGKATDTNGYEGLVLDDPTEDSDFMVPLYEPIYRSMPITHATQMVQVSGYAIINCYKIVKKKWYQTGIFQIVVIIVVAVISYFFPPAAGTAGGILGTNVAVGTAILGATASAMVIAIVGSIVNSIAAMIVASIISMAANEIIGGKLGVLISTIFSAWAASGFSFNNLANSMSSMFNNMSSAASLLKLTSTALDVGSLVMKLQGADIMSGIDEIQANVDRAQEISALYNDTFANNTIITPEMIRANSEAFRLEPLDSFLSRTLMTGTDIVETTHSMISDFVSINLQLPNLT